MRWIDDEISYPWSNPVARELHGQLVDAFFEPSEVRTLVKSARKPNVNKIAFDGRSIHQIWVDTLERAAAEGGLRVLLTYILAEASVPGALEGLLRSLLDDAAAPDAAPPLTPGQRGKDGPAVDALTRPEALLFGDDLSESVGEIRELLASIERVMRWQSAICHLKVLASNGVPYVGTGTLLTGNRVLTNHHVIYPDGHDPARVSVVFHFELDVSGQHRASTVVLGDLAAIRSSKDDDWATIALTTAPPVDASAFDLGAQLATAVASERAFILQHPGGKPKRLAFVRNRILRVDARRVYYATDTQGGSSGAPVFNGQGRIIALHRAGGDPQKFIGVAPVRHNEGVRIDVIAPDVLKPA